MNKADQLKQARNILLRLHKSLVDRERAAYERVNGVVTSGQFLNLLLSDYEFEWLRKYSTLIVEIDEMFDLNDGYTDEMVSANLVKLRDLVDLRSVDEAAGAKYQFALQSSTEIAAQHSELRNVLGKE